MEQEKLDYILITMLVLLCAITIFTIIKHDNRTEEIIKYCSKCYDMEEDISMYGRLQLWNDSIKYMVQTNGLYTPGEYYCVWTANRTMSEINRTDYHETCHDFIYNDYNHFCIDKIYYYNGTDTVKATNEER